MLEYRTIGEAWLNCCQLCLEQGRTYTIQRGSYVGQQRKQLDTLAFIITHPETRPLGIEYRGQPISSDDAILTYFQDYLISPYCPPNTQYTYGQRVEPQLEAVCEMLRQTPDTNQAIIEVGKPGDVWLDDPPCLRLISFKALPEGLQMTTFWRSWDLCAGLPMNLGGLQLLLEFVAEWAGLKPGRQVCVSDGAHLYDHSWRIFK